MRFLDTLNEAQREAVVATEGPVLVLAGAGSGKTRVITYRIAYLLRKLDVPARRILAVTFTNKAASEMRERIEDFVGKQQGLTIATFHSFGVKFLREEIEAAGYQKQFSIYSDTETQGVLKDIALELNLDEEKYPSKLLSWAISKAKNELKTPDEAASLDDATFRMVYKMYQERLKSLNALDFDDLIFLPVRLMRENAEIREKWSQRFQYVMVDEYQDTNFSQYWLMKLLSGFHENLCVVGDDDQSIYAFRGAKVENILRFEKEFKKAKVITLNVNYRSTDVILKAAYGLIEQNQIRHQKSVTSHLGGGDKVVSYEAIEPEEESEWIASQIFDNRIQNKIPYHHQAVLCRTNTQMRPLEKAFRERSIPYNLIGGYSFFDRKEVKDILSYLKLIYNTNDNQALLRTINFPKRGIGSKSLVTIRDYASEKGYALFDAIHMAFDIKGITKPVQHKLEMFTELIKKFQDRFNNPGLSGILQELIDEAGFILEYERLYKEEAPYRIKSVEGLIDMAKNYEKRCKRNKEYPSLEGFLTSLSLFNREDDEEEEENKVSIMTIHSAKGLEFDAVFIPGFEEGFLPHERSIDEAGGIEEERRLAYVAITRAKERLFISQCCTRKIFGQELDRKPSRFLKEIPDEVFLGEGEDNSPEATENFYLDQLKQLKEQLGGT